MGARVLAVLSLETSICTVLASYLIVVVVRSTVTLAVAVLPSLMKVGPRLTTATSAFRLHPSSIVSIDCAAGSRPSWHHTEALLCISDQ